MMLFDDPKILNSAYALTLLAMGYLIAKQASLFIERAMAKRFSRHHTMLAKRALFYVILAIFCATGLQHLGFKLSVLLGAAGVFTVAISFASQTAASNLISGIFLLIEHPYKVGDTIEVKGITGVVDSMDLLSTKLKTPDNKLVRIPNEAMIKAEITNLSYFSTCRIDLLVAVAYECDLSQVKSLLFSIADHDDKILKEPEPSIIIDHFSNAAVELRLMVWINNVDVDQVKNKLQEMIKHQFDKEGIVSPPPQLTVSRVEPFVS